MNNVFRKCTIDGEIGLFHGWFNDGHVILNGIGGITGSVVTTVALVEFEDGSVKAVEPLKVKFLENSLKSIECNIEGEYSEHAHWVYWPGWRGNHDQRIEDAKCSKCGYIHPTVYGSLKRLAPFCPCCGRKMDVGGK